MSLIDVGLRDETQPTKATIALRFKGFLAIAFLLISLSAKCFSMAIAISQKRQYRAWASLGLSLDVQVIR